jgi:hypothetical protein
MQENLVYCSCRRRREEECMQGFCLKARKKEVDVGGILMLKWMLRDMG